MQKYIGMAIAILFFNSLSLKAQNTLNKMDSLSYSIGILMAENLKQQGFGDINPVSMADAINDVMKGNELKVPLNEAQALVNNFAKEKAMAKSAEARSGGEKFLAENAKREGVSTTATGLQYEVMQSGDGATPGPTDKVKVHYHGSLIDGTVFDSSVDRGEPISFPVNGVIAGWTEALQLMKVGDKWKIFIPYNLAYGERGAGAQIPPFAALVFEVELLGIE
ncbi:FKBP-type peptidyl-prolyl cis-trans isomerase [Portibacter lacus]|uniref:Peptidyl-prolyl cis-trans isomerase n=1 Tax=Portibacter lacus TaxID=1099794 RepID=A0AA37ST67_9BACT|nr:FKBP-type peptidyl-prolyl cis-trans isomerase [Portibacter lacus]GLR20048.1 peptidyl-prolyl cis-trans isomerase [Portibacter lacus]